jgi:hypothetical protein
VRRQANLWDAPPVADITPEDCLLSTQQAADILGISFWTLQYWRTRTDREGPDFIRLGKRVKYSIQALRRFARARTVRRHSLKRRLETARIAVRAYSTGRSRI